MMHRLYSRLRYLLLRRRMDRELAEEIESHRAMMTAEHRAAFGNTTRLLEEARDEWSWNWVEQILQDVRYGVRTLWNSPGFTIGAVAVLTLGIGVNLAEFQVFRALLSFLSGVRDAESVLQLDHRDRKGSHLAFSSGTVEFLRANSTRYAWLGSEDTSFDLVVESDAAVRATLVSPDYFAGIGIVPAWGRLLDVHDSAGGAPPVVVLGHAYWQNRWGADPTIVGRIIRISGKPVQVVGVAPFGFSGLGMRRSEIWLPRSLRPALAAGTRPVEQDFERATESLFGRLKPGTPIAAADAELTALMGELSHRQPSAFPQPETLQGRYVEQSVRETVAHSPAAAIFVLMVFLVLVSASANLGNMLLARGLARQREITIRSAIGAGRARIVRQLMTENLILAILGAATGLAFGSATADVMLALSDAPAARVTLGWPAVATALALTLISAAAFGLPAALQTARPNRRASHLRQSLVGVQVAVSCLLLIVSGVLARNGIRNAGVDLAFDYRNLVVVDPQFYNHPRPPAINMQKLQALTDALAALPGVTGVTAATVPPLGGRTGIENIPGAPRVYRNEVAPNYFAALELPIVRGRTFLAGERDAAVVSESAARALWPAEDPLGKTIRLAGADRTVAGVVRDSGASQVADPDSIEVYTALSGRDFERCALILHSRSDPGPLLPLIPAIGAAQEENVSAMLMRSYRENYLTGQRRLMMLIGSVGAVATVLAASGMFALVAFAVAQRRRELGIRMAIGARPRHILGVLLTENAKPTLVGGLIGLVVAFGLSRLVLYVIYLRRVFQADMLGFVVGLACFAAVAVAATLTPAMRALRIDPASTLREE